VAPYRSCVASWTPPFPLGGDVADHSRINLGNTSQNSRISSALCWAVPAARLHDPALSFHKFCEGLRRQRRGTPSCPPLGAAQHAERRLRHHP
jgi:hypothetical protein